MAKNQSTYTLRIDAELGNLQQTLSQAQSSLQSFMASGSAPKGLEKAFEKIRDLLGQIQDKTGKPLDLKGLTSTGKSLDSVQESFSAIIRLLGDFNDLSDDLKLSFLGEEDRRKVEAVTAAMREYQKTLETTAAKQRELEAAQKKQEKDTGQVGRATKKVSDISDKKAAAEAKRSAKQGQLGALESLGDKADPVRVAKLRGEIGQLNTDIEQMERALETANTELTDAQTALRLSSEEVSRLGAEMDTASGQALAQLKREAEKLGISLSELDGKEASEQIEILTSKMSELKAQMMASGQDGFEAVQQGFQRAGQAANEMGEQVQEATECVRQMDEVAAQRDAFEDKIKQFLGLKGAAHVLRAALRDAMSTITELDATMTQMAVVTDLTVGDYWDQLPEYSKQASELGVSINSAYEAATLYYQQGLKGNEVTKISAETLKLAKIANLDAADATDKMTAALRGFNMELDQASAQKISDVYSKLAAITAADVDEISSAMTKTASIASSAGMEFETTAAFLSQIIETTRESAETAGTAMKTVIARFQELKKDPKDIGEVDGEIVDANAIETALRSVGVSLRDASGQFRDLDDVFLELSSKWNTLDKNTQRYIATIAAGSRQQSRFIAMMQDYGRTQELVTAANNSAGASQKQFEKTMESLQSKVEKLKNAWHEFTMGIMDSSFVKTGVDILTKFLEIINKATSALDGIGGSLTKISTILTVFKIGKSLFSKISDGFKAMWIDIIKIAIDGGEKAGDGALQGAQRAKQRAQQQNGRNLSSTPTRTSEEGGPPSEPPKRMGFRESFKRTFSKEGAKEVGASVWHGGLSLTGATDFVQGAKTMFAGGRKARATLAEDRFAGKSREDLQANIDAAKAKRAEYSVDARGGYHKKGKKGSIKKAEYDAGVAAADEEIQTATQDLADYDQAQEDVINHSKDGWNQMAEGIGKAGMALTGAGMAVTGIGQAFIDAGYEEFGEGMQKVGGIMTTVGSITSLVSTGMSILSAIFPVAGTAGTAAGTATNLAWSPISIIILIIVAALAAFLVLFLIIASVAKKNSPEDRLEKAKEAAEAAAKAAEEAAEAYQNLADSFESLKDSYKSLEDLTEGTEEWRKAMRETNAEVMELINQYPELASLVQNDGGVLRIDLDSKEAQEVLNQAYERTITTANASVMANIDVQNAQADVDRDKLDKKVDFEYDAATGKQVKDENGAHQTNSSGYQLYETSTGGTSTSAYATFELNDNQIDQVAKGMADGTLLDPESDEAQELLEQVGITTEQFEHLKDSMGDNINSVQDYGKSLINNEIQQEQAYDAMASSIVGLVDTMGMADERIKQMFNFADGEVYEEAYKEMEGALSGANLVPHDSSQDWRENFTEAMVTKFGEGARDIYTEEYVEKALDAAGYKDANLEENGKITYIDNQGHQQTGDVDDDYIKKAVAKYYATTIVKEQASNFEAYMAGMTDYLTTKEDAESSATINAMNKALLDENGGSLTNADIQALAELTDEDLDEAFNSLSDDLKRIYGNADKYKAEIDSAKSKGERSLAASKVVIEGMGLETFGFMDADTQKGYAKKMQDVYHLEGGSDAVQDIEDAYTDLINGKTDVQKKEIAKLANEADWTNQESLLRLQLQLETQFGYTEEAAKEFISTLGTAAHATSKLTTTVDVYGEVWQATEKLNQSMKKLTALQWEYNRAIEQGEGGISDTMDAMLTEYSNQTSYYSDAFEANQDDLAKLYAQGGLNYGGIDLREAVSIGAYGIEVDQSRLSEYVSSEMISQEDADAFISNLQDTYDKQEEYLQGMQDNLEAIEELEQQGKDAYYELRDMVKDTLVSALQEQIDIQQATLDATNSANDRLIGKIQEQIDDTRQARQNEEAEKNIADLHSQAAYLGMDTSGANNLAMVGLEDQIAQAEQDYQDTLIDQALQNLSDANAEAAEQRERQIFISQQQLEAYQNSAEFQQQADQELASLIAAGNEWQNTEFGKKLYENFTQGMSSTEAGEFAESIGSKVDLAKVWQDTDWVSVKDGLKDTLTTMKNSLSTMSTFVTQLANEKKLADQKTKLMSKGFSEASLEGATEEELDSYTAFVAKQNTNGTAGSTYQAIKNAGYGNDVLTEAQYIADIISKKPNDKSLEEYLAEQAVTYEDYLLNRKAELKNQSVSTAVTDYLASNTSNTGLRGYKGSVQYNEDYETYKALGGGDKDSFDALLKASYSSSQMTGHFPSTTKGYTGVDNMTEAVDDQWWFGDAKVDGESVGKVAIPHHLHPHYSDWFNGGRHSEFDDINGDSNPQQGWLFMYQGEPYGYNGWGWAKITAGHETESGKHKDLDDGYKKLKEKMQAYLTGFKTGGLADFTGPAWLDGTPSKPEYILNAQQTERFFSLVDVLEGLKTEGEPKKSSGDNYFDINISVEKIEDDYDVEQMADKIRRMIYDDATYRNVNAINHIR